MQHDLVLIVGCVCFMFQYVEEFVLQAQAVLEQGLNPGDTVDTVYPLVPGVCYMRLLEDLSPNCSEGRVDGFYIS